MRDRIQSIDWQDQLETGRERAAEARGRLSDVRDLAAETQGQLRQRAAQTQEQLRERGEQARQMQDRVPEPPRNESRLRFPTGLLLGICVGVVISLILIWRASQGSAGQAHPTNIELLPRRGNGDPSGKAVSG